MESKTQSRAAGLRVITMRHDRPGPVLAGIPGLRDVHVVGIGRGTALHQPVCGERAVLKSND